MKRFIGLAAPTMWAYARYGLLVLVSAFALLSSEQAAYAQNTWPAAAHTVVSQKAQKAKPAASKPVLTPAAKAVLEPQAVLIPTAAQAVRKPAPLGRRFIEGVETPQELAAIFRCDRDPARGGHPNGIEIVNIKVCGRPGMRAHASQRDFLVMMQLADPDERLTFDNMLAYLDTLERVIGDPSIRYRSACLKPTTRDRSPTGYLPEMDCNVRAPEPGEYVWINPRTRKVVFLQNCANPVSGPEDPNCIQLLAYGGLPPEGYVAVMRYAATGSTFIPRCWKVQRPDDTEAHTPWQDLCPTVSSICDPADIEQAFNTKVQRIGSFATVPGWYVFDVPPEHADMKTDLGVALCLEYWDVSEAPAELRDNPQGLHHDELVNGLLTYSDPYTAHYSNSLHVVAHDYLRNRYGRMVATVYLDEAEARKHKARTRRKGVDSVLYWQWNVDWQAVNAQADRRSRQ